MTAGLSRAHTPMKCAAWAAVTVAVLWAWQALIVYADYGGNWTGLFLTGDHVQTPAELASRTYFFKNSGGFDGQFYRFVAHDPFFRKGIQLIVDGTDPKVVHEILEIEVEHHEEHGILAAKVWEAAGGYAPTVGILGAVLGLIHVMENLADPSKLGGGIAVAFVATVYGVGAANLFFLPFANKIKFKIKEESAARNVIVMGLVGLAQGENPRLLEEKLDSFLPAHERVPAAKK